MDMRAAPLAVAVAVPFAVADAVDVPFTGAAAVAVAVAVAAAAVPPASVADASGEDGLEDGPGSWPHSPTGLSAPPTFAPAATFSLLSWCPAAPPAFAALPMLWSLALASAATQLLALTSSGVRNWNSSTTLWILREKRWSP